MKESEEVNKTMMLVCKNEREVNQLCKQLNCTNEQLYDTHEVIIIDNTIHELTLFMFNCILQQTSEIITSYNDYDDTVKLMSYIKTMINKFVSIVMK